MTQSHGCITSEPTFCVSTITFMRQPCLGKPSHYHAHQAAEKALKALLVSQRSAVPYIHDLNALLCHCLDAGADPGNLLDDCALLTPYAIANRYPGDEPEITEADGQLAVAAAHRIVQAVERLLDLS